MAKLFLFMMVSLDGYFEGENHDISWHNVDKEFNKFAATQMKEVECLLFGRKTYELMRDYWPDAKPEDEYDKTVAQQMNTLPKFVVSHKLKEEIAKKNWNNVFYINHNVFEEIAKLKDSKKGAIGLLGSNNLCTTLLENNLVDELRLMINPLVIGIGTPLFSGIKQKYKCMLQDSRFFTNGNTLLTYKV